MQGAVIGAGHHPQPIFKLSFQKNCSRNDLRSQTSVTPQEQQIDSRGLINRRKTDGQKLKTHSVLRKLVSAESVGNLVLERLDLVADNS